MPRGAILRPIYGLNAVGCAVTWRRSMWLVRGKLSNGLCAGRITLTSLEQYTTNLYVHCDVLQQISNLLAEAASARVSDAEGERLLELAEQSLTAKKMQVCSFSVAVSSFKYNKKHGAKYRRANAAAHWFRNPHFSQGTAVMC